MKLSSLDQEKLLFSICKIVAESDSIGEGWSMFKGCYDSEVFEKEKQEIDQSNYINEAGIPILNLFLKFLEDK